MSDLRHQTSDFEATAVHRPDARTQTGRDPGLPRKARGRRNPPGGLAILNFHRN